MAHRRTPLRAPWTLALLGAAVVAAACGGEDPRAFRRDPNKVFARAMQAVHDADWDVLVSLLTKEARFTLERDLGRLKARLAHPQDGAREREIARARLGEAFDAELARATSGSLADVLRFFVLLSPREAQPAAPQRKLGAFEVEILYVDGDGNRRPVRLVRSGEEWLIEALHL